MPFSRKLTNGLYELRGKGKLKIRIIYAYKNKEYILLHIFNKKSQKTPPKEIETALKRLTTI
jgi:phage-related protein